MSHNEKLFDFIEASPTAFHTVLEIKKHLDENGYTELYEKDCWKLNDGGKYYTVKNGTSIIAFRYKSNYNGYVVVASHSDQPSFRLKMTPEAVGAYTRLQVERYGGMIMYSWLDRPLSVAGRVSVRTESGIKNCLINIDRDLAVIPSVAIHMNRGVNDGYKFNPAVDMLPLVGAKGSAGKIADIISESVGASKEDIVGHDLFLYNRQRGTVFGADNEFILSPRLDDLQCVYSSLAAFLASGDSASVPVLAVFDNEEVGSETKQGAASSFLHDILWRISGSDQNYFSHIASSFMVSADNAHAKHPNHPELSDPDNAPILNGGIVIKWNANQRYTTDGVSAALFGEICKRAGAKFSYYYNRADMLGGSTLGSISNTKVSLPTVDIGLAQLGMHSSTETAGAFDTDEMVLALTCLYNSSVVVTSDKVDII